MDPRVKALQYIKYALDAIEELRHLNPDGVCSIKTFSGKLAAPGIKGGEFKSILEKIESKEIANFEESSWNSAKGWGSNTLLIKINDWTRFNNYRTEVISQLDNVVQSESVPSSSDKSPKESIAAIHGKKKLSSKWKIIIWTTLLAPLIIIFVQTLLAIFVNSSKDPDTTAETRIKDQKVERGIGSVNAGGNVSITYTDAHDKQSILVQGIDVFPNRSESPDGSGPLTHVIFPKLTNVGSAIPENVRLRVYVLFFDSVFDGGDLKNQPLIDDNSSFVGIKPTELRRSGENIKFDKIVTGKAAAIIIHTTYQDTENNIKNEVNRFKYTIGQEGALPLIDQEYKNLGFDRLKEAFKDDPYLLEQI